MLTQGEERDNSKYICTYRDARKDVLRVDQTSSKHWRYGFRYALEKRTSRIIISYSSVRVMSTIKLC